MGWRIPPMKIRRIDHSQSAMKSQEGRIISDELGIDRAVYAKMSSLTDNKTLIEPIDNLSPFDRFLLDMDQIHQGDTSNPVMMQVDKYLGNLGDTVNYPFADDTYNVEPWIDTTEQSAYRNVITSQADIDYNVITDISGVLYNVIHNTEVLTTQGVVNGRP